MSPEYIKRFAGGFYIVDEVSPRSKLLTVRRAVHQVIDPKVPEGDFLTDNGLYISRERFSNTLAVPAEFSQQSLEDMLAALKRESDRLGSKIAIRPTRLMVHPSWTRERIEERLRYL